LRSSCLQALILARTLDYQALVALLSFSFIKALTGAGM
jgi:hypothetical protein